jgi:PIN domain-containing protein
VIIFDTCVLRGLGSDDPKLDLLRALRQSGQQQVAIPWMVQEELVAQRVLGHAKAHADAVAATRTLNRTAPWAHEPGPGSFDRDAANAYWRKHYQGLFDVIETSGDVARQALQREANRQKPAKGPEAGDKGGARDTAIWLSVVDYLKANPGETAYFVTGNTRDFGDGTGFPAPMDADIKGLESRLKLITSFDHAVSEFTIPLEIDELTRDILVGLLTSDDALTLLRRSVRDPLSAQPGPWDGNTVHAYAYLPLPAADAYQPVRWGTWAREPRAVLRRVQDIAGHKIGEESWYTATVDWILVGQSSPPVSASPVRTPPALVLAPAPTWIACQWRTRLLFTSKPGERLTILQYSDPESLDPAERDEWEPLVRKAAPQITVTAPLPEVAGSPVGLAILAGFAIWGLVKKKPGSPGNGVQSAAPA